MNQSSNRTEGDDLQIKIQNCLLKILKSAEHLLDQQIVEEIRVKIQQISEHDSLIQSIQYFAFSLINKLQLISQRTTKLDINSEDYQNLEGSVQKAEAEIRKHIRLEQQLKLYMDGLEDRIEELQTQLKIETQKYHQLFQSTKALDLQKRQLKKKLKSIEMKYRSHESTSKDIRIISHKVSKNLLSEPSVSDSSNPYYVPSTEKHKLLRRKKSGDKSAQVPKTKQNNYTSYKKLIENDIRVSLNDSPKKKKSMQQPIHEQPQNNINTNTLYLKEGYKKHSRKLMKYSTDQQYLKNKKEARSSSVCQ